MIDQFLVLGAAVPTQGNVHEVLPEARVLYTDIDPVNIQRGQEILAGIPRTGYTYCDASDLSTLTTQDRTVVERVLGPLRRVGVIMVGVSAFIPDDKLRLIFRDLHKWAPKGSYLLFEFDSTKGHEIPAAVELMGAGFICARPRRLRLCWATGGLPRMESSPWGNGEARRHRPISLPSCMAGLRTSPELSEQHHSSLSAFFSSCGEMQRLSSD